MKVLLDYSLEEIQDIVKELGEQRFRAKQIYIGLYQGKSFNEISNISQNLKQKLIENYISEPVQILDKKVSNDGTIKFLYKLYDNNVIEGVLMKYKYGYTLCVSTQVGCKMRCAFCASGIDGLVRNLSCGEILGQVIEVNQFLEGSLKEDRKITNIVLMGSGEPLDNYDNVKKFIKLVNNENGLNISERNISLSTCGIVENIYKLADDGMQITLTISLHAPFDEMRKKLMPISNKYTIGDIIKACKYYFNKTGRRVVFEYVLIKGVNTTDECINELSKLMKGFSYHINVISLNSVEEKDLQGTTREEAFNFVKKLQSKHISATLRRTMGQDINGACGQLRRKYLKEN